jgi:hypothetical protein
LHLCATQSTNPTQARATPSLLFPIVSWLAIQKPSDRQHIGNSIDAAMMFVRADFINVLCWRVHCDFGAYQDRSPWSNFRFGGKADSAQQFCEGSDSCKLSDLDFGS